MRIHCLENVDKALQFLKEQKVHLENMGSHDIVDGNHRLTLGLVWTIILRFQVTWAPSTLRGLDRRKVPEHSGTVSLQCMLPRQQSRAWRGRSDSAALGICLARV